MNSDFCLMGQSFIWHSAPYETQVERNCFMLQCKFLPAAKPTGLVEASWFFFLSFFLSPVKVQKTQLFVGRFG